MQTLHGLLHLPFEPRSRMEIGQRLGGEERTRHRIKIMVEDTLARDPPVADWNLLHDRHQQPCQCGTGYLLNKIRVGLSGVVEIFQCLVDNTDREDEVFAQCWISIRRRLKSHGPVFGQRLPLAQIFNLLVGGIAEQQRTGLKGELHLGRW